MRSGLAASVRSKSPPRRRQSARAAEVRAELKRRLSHEPFQPFFVVVPGGYCGCVYERCFIALSRGPWFKVYSRGDFVTAKYSVVSHIAALTVDEAIRYAETVLPGKAEDKGPHSTRRWQAVILIGEFIEQEPSAVWDFIAKWGCHRRTDLSVAIAVCLLEHLLEHHFTKFFPKVRKLALTNRYFAMTYRGVWKFGQSKMPANSAKLDRLRKRLDALDRW
jgi:hypothetical protein